MSAPLDDDSGGGVKAAIAPRIDGASSASSTRVPSLEELQLLTTIADGMALGRERLPNQLVYVPDARDGYALGRIVDVGAEALTVRLESAPTATLDSSGGGSGVLVRASYSETVPAVEDQNADYEDNCVFKCLQNNLKCVLFTGSLMYLNEGTLLHNCKLRYERKQIYVSIFTFK